MRRGRHYQLLDAHPGERDVYRPGGEGPVEGEAGEAPGDAPERRGTARGQECGGEVRDAVS